MVSPLAYDLGNADDRDRRKLTFYFKADKRIDFRELTKENFRIFKSRIWMAMVAKDGSSHLQLSLRPADIRSEGNGLRLEN